MPSSKRYTNTTFTRRVDHEAGRHRTPGAQAGRRVCERCGAVSEGRRWTRAGTAHAESLKALAALPTTLCRACRMAAEGQFAGEVRITGAFLARHRDDVERLIENEATRAGEDNPMARILEISHEAPDRMILRTSTEHLAKRLGQALHKAYHGDVHYGFSHENKFAHVTWAREE